MNSNYPVPQYQPQLPGVVDPSGMPLIVWVILIAIGIAFGLLFLIILIKSFRYICFPNEILVFTGRKYTLDDGRETNMKVLFGGGGWKVPLIERVYKMDMTAIPIEVHVKNAYSKGNIPLNVQAIANVKVSNNPKRVTNAIERFLGKGKAEIWRVAKETLEANLRNILATLTPEQINEDRLKFANAVGEEVEEDLEKLGLMLDTLKIQHVSDEIQYLESIGRKRIAEVIKEAEIAESDADRESKTYEAAQMANSKVAQEEAQKQIKQSENKYNALKAELENQVIGLQNSVEAASREARAAAEQQLQQIRTKQEQLRLQSEVVNYAEAEKSAKELLAEAEAAPILENGKALAASLQMLTDAWVKAGSDAKDIYLIQQLENLTKIVVESIKNMEIKEVNILDNGKGETLPNYVASFPAVVNSVLKTVKESIGVDIPEILKADDTEQNTMKGMVKTFK